MARKRYTTEQIIGMLREAEVKLSQGETVAVICRGLGISEQSCYRWRRVLFPHTWVPKAALPQLEEHVASLKKHPPIPAGAPDPYEPPKPQ